MAKYVQKCNECGTRYYMDDPAQKKSVCDVCGKRSIRMSVPALIPDEGDASGEAVKKAASSQSPEGTGKRPPSGPQGSGSGPVSSEGKTGWSEVMKDHQDQLETVKEPGLTRGQTSRLWLKVSGNPGDMNLKLDDAKGPVFIGRGWTRAQYFEKDTRISWIHCVFFRMADGKWYIRDLQSTNGTFLCEVPGGSETPVSAYEPTVLVKGGVIKLGPWDDAVRMEVIEA